MQAGKTKDQGSYNEPSAAVHSGALAAGTLLRYNTYSLKVILIFNPYFIGTCKQDLY